MLEPSAILEVLNNCGVAFVVIGGMAATIHDLPLPATVVLDITPSRKPDNLERLAAALEELEAGLLSADTGGTWFPRHPVENWAQHDTLHLMTRFGPLDLVFAPDGAVRGYDDLRDTSESLTIDGVPALVISVATWERLKEASGRAKDLEHLDRFRANQRY